MCQGTRKPEYPKGNPTFQGTRTRPEPEGLTPEPDPNPTFDTRTQLGIKIQAKFHQNEQKFSKIFHKIFLHSFSLLFQHENYQNWSIFKDRIFLQ